MHQVAEQLEDALSIPLIHIADATGAAVVRRGLTHVGLLGTRFTMERDFYRNRLSEWHGLTVSVPDEEQRALVHRIIYEELVVGQVHEASRRHLVDIIGDLAAHGAQGVILGCTEIPLLVRPADVSLPLFDTMAEHATCAVELALQKRSASEDK